MITSGAVSASHLLHHRRVSPQTRRAERLCRSPGAGPRGDQSRSPDARRSAGGEHGHRLSGAACIRSSWPQTRLAVEGASGVPAADPTLGR